MRILLPLLLLLAGCGQSGDLYLPEEPAVPAGAPPVEDPEKKKDR